MTKYIIGHKNPDTDAIASAISYAYLKQQLGDDCKPGRLGPMNEETKYAIKTFGIEEPEILGDARAKLSEIEIDEAIEIDENMSCNEALSLVRHSSTRTLFVTEDHRLKGIVSISDLTSIRSEGLQARQDNLSRSPLSLINNDVKGTILYESPQFATNGCVLAYDPRNREEDYSGDIFIIRNDVYLYSALHENPGLVIFVGDGVDDRTVKLFEEMNVSLILTQMSIEEILRIIYEAIPVSIVMKDHIVAYEENEYVDDIKTKILNTRFRCYPVANEEGKLVGCISRYHVFNHKKKEFILVDHSSYVQSINNLNKADVVEIIDHHNIGNVETAVPIYYRNQLCGCTCTIVYQMFKENEIVPPKSYAGLMLSAIISDTLNFQSKTTTDLDRRFAKELAEIAGVDLNEYAENLLNASVNLKNVDVIDMIQRDLKQYKISHYQVAVSQTNYSNIQDIQGRIGEFKEALSRYQEEKGYDLEVMMFTNVRGDGSLFLVAGHLKDVLFDIIETKFDEESGFDSHIMSRKQQLIPSLSKRLENF